MCMYWYATVRVSMCMTTYTLWMCLIVFSDTVITMHTHTRAHTNAYVHTYTCAHRHTYKDGIC